MKKTFLPIGFVFILLLFFSGKERVKSPFKLPKYLKYYSYIPAGPVFLDHGFTTDGNPRVDSINVDAFYMNETEVANIHYREFLWTLRRDEKDSLLQIALPDSTNWCRAYSYGEPYISSYFRHPAYVLYPVVNISKEAAQLYCEWMTETINENEAEGELVYEFRLPTRYEWLYAARGGNQYARYSWDSPMLKDREGNPQCAYKDIANERITEASDGECYFEEDFTISSLRGKRLSITYRHFDPFSIYAYGPHRFGLYNMNGNVAEMVADRDIVVGGSWKNTGYDVRNESMRPFDSTALDVGFRTVMIVRNRD